MLDFLGIGAQKAATTWIYYVLSQHPGIAFPAGKEVHFWNQRQGQAREWYDAVAEQEGSAPVQDLAWYTGLFAGEDGALKGEMTPAYAILPPEVIQEIYAFNPALKVIYSVRHPFDRAWSAALMALSKAQMTLEEASDAWFCDHFASQASLSRGDYAACLDQWLSVFPREQLLVLQYEQIAAHPEAAVNALCDFLGVEAAPLLEAEGDVLQQKLFTSGGGAVRPSLRPALEALYRDKMQALKDSYAIDYTA